MVKLNYHGLTNEQVIDSRKKRGNNKLPPPRVETFWEKLWDNFNDPLIKILIVALVITLLLAFFGYSDWLESFGIASAVFLATFVSTYSEHKNEASFQALQAEASMSFTKTFRSGLIQTVLSDDLVVGDLILLQPGEIVPADGILISGHIMLNEATLTGESEGRSKTCTEDVQEEKHFEIDETELNHVRRSCIIMDGEAVMAIHRVGIDTEYGKVALMLSECEARESPLQVKLSKLADQISKLGYIGASAIAVSFLFKQIVIDNSWNWEQIMNYMSQSGLVVHDLVKSVILAIIVIVVAVPEGLPMMIAIVLSLNMNRLLKDKVLVRKLLGIETAGSISLLLSDKTGTMTKGKFDPVLFLSGSFRTYKKFMDIPEPLGDSLACCLRSSSECLLNEPSSGRKAEIIGGNASDQALLSFLPQRYLAHHMKLNGNDRSPSPNSSSQQQHIDNHSGSASNSKLDSHAIIQTIFELESFKQIMFNSSRKFSATSKIIPSDIISSCPASCSRDGHVTFVKGTPELVLPRCSHFYSEKGQIMRLDSMSNLMTEIDLSSNQGIRMIAIATSPTLIESEYDATEPPGGMVLVGIVGIRDEVRSSTKSAILTAAEAGIHTIMITGDKKETAIAVARQVGLLEEIGIKPSKSRGDGSSKATNNSVNTYMDGDYYEDVSKCVLTHEEMSEMSNQELSKLIPSLKVVARALPIDKSRLVQLAQENGEVVGMTGDGLNDAVALRYSDVGFAMGSGVDVAKEASDIVVLDDNFASTMKAVLYGRTIFKSIRKFIVFQSTVNLASMIIVFMGPFLGFDFPLTLIQLLWVNLVMDTLAAIAFGGEPPLARYLNETPIQRHSPIISPYMWSSILFNGIYVAVLSIFFLTHDSVAALFLRNGTPDHEVFLTAFFCFFIFISNFNSFNARTTTTNITEHIMENPNFVTVVGAIFGIQILFTYFGGSVLRTVPLTFGEWFIVFTFAVTIIPIDLIRKKFVVPQLERRFFLRQGNIPHHSNLV